MDSKTRKRMDEQRETEQRIRDACDHVLTACGEDLEAAREAAGRILRAAYYRQIRGMSDGIRAEIKSGEIKTEEDLDRRIDEYADCDLVIYTGKAMDVYNASDNRDAWQDVTDKIAELAPRETDDIPWTQIAAHALIRDLSDDLGEDRERLCNADDDGAGE